MTARRATHREVELAAAAVRRYPLCRLVDAVDGEYFTSRAPLAVEEVGRDNMVLVGHVSRTNPHLPAWRASRRTLCLVEGAHTYVSPTCYERQPSVPTWNYCSVTLTGRTEIIESSEETLDVLLVMMREIEPELLHDGGAGEPTSYYRSLLPAITAFRLRVDRVHVAEKTSRHRSRADRSAIANFATTTAFSSGKDYPDMVGWLDGWDQPAR